MKTYRKATAAEIIAINDKLKEVIEPTGLDGYVSYIDGWTDQRVADEIGVPSALAVRKVRQEVFGLVKSRRGEGKMNTAKLTARVEAFEKVLADLASADGDATLTGKRIFDLSQQVQTVRNQNAELIEALHDLATRYNALIDRLVTDQIAPNAYHLRVKKTTVGKVL